MIESKTCVLSIRTNHTDLATVAKILKEEYEFETDSLGSLASHCVYFLAYILQNKYKSIEKFTSTEDAITYLKERGLKDQKISRRRGGALLKKLNEESFEIPTDIDVKEIEVDEDLKGI